MKYQKPQIKTRKIKLNLFLSNRSRDSFAFPLIGPVFAQSATGGPTPPGGGNGGASAGNCNCGACNCMCAPGGGCGFMGGSVGNAGAAGNAGTGGSCAGCAAACDCFCT